MSRIFLLSPAHAGGKRAELLFNPRATFALAQRLHAGEAVPLGEIYQFLSGLYFRGKLAYATQFGWVNGGWPGALVITPTRGLLSTQAPTTLSDLRALATVDIHESEPRYRQPLLRDARKLAANAECDVVLLGSISTAKYAEPLLSVFGERLWFPIEFVGRGDMSRGALMLRCAREGRELAYQRLAGAMTRGPRARRISEF
jgi:hypothetical protein